MERVRILHAADIHLGEDLYGNAHGPELPRQALRALVDVARGAGADLVIIAGDLFDSNRVDSDTVEFAIEQLLRLPVPAVVLPGNHDCLVADSVYERPEFTHMESPIHILRAADGETVDFPDLDTAVWGKPITSYGGDLRPLAIPPLRVPRRWRLALGHGYYSGETPDSLYSFQISREEIENSGMDYVALGHHSEFRCVFDGAVKACYSGSASSGSRSVVLVDLVDGSGVFISPRRLPL